MNYITLKNSNGTLEKRFHVQSSGYDVTKHKTQREKIALDGTFDVSIGAVVSEMSFVIRAPLTSSDPLYGTVGDLETFYSYNDPNGSPSNEITLTDHYGNEHSVIMTGDFKKQLLGVVLDGEYIVKVTFKEISQ